jgi:S-layer protein (TIGR01567 family)
MKRFTVIALIALLAIAAAVMPASAADSVEVRGPVYNDSTLGDITSAAGDYIEMNATNFAGFYYDIDANVSTETLRILNASVTGDKTIDEDGLEYNTTIAAVEYESSNLAGTYNVMGLFAEEYTPLKYNTPDKLGKLLLDEDEKYTLRTGTALELAGGYELTAKQIDVDGKKVWMELSKDGEFIEDEVVSLADDSEGETWTYERDDVAGEDDVVVFKANITDVFQGQVDSLAVVDGVWLMDFENILEIESDDEFGELKVSTIGDDYLLMTNDATMTLTRDSTQDIAEGMSFKVADDPDAVRFYLMKEYTDAGTYEVRGTVYEDEPGSWDYSSFAGFFYDLDDDVETETLEITTTTLDDDHRTIGEHELEYNTTIEAVGYESSNLAGTYNVMGLFAEKYIPLKYNTPDKLGKLLLDEDEKYTLRTGTALELEGGYELTAKQIDVDGKKVWMELSKDGEFIEDEVVSLADDSEGETWTYERDDVAGEDDVVVFRANITDVFQGQVDSLAVVDGIWLMDFDNILEIESDDEFGELKVATIGDDYLLMDNDATISLTSDSEKTIAENMNFKVADNDTVLRYYPFVDVTIGESVAEDDTADAEEETTEVVEETPAENATEETTEVVEDTTTEMPTEEEDTTTTEETAEEDSPGFEAVFAVAGLLAVAYLVRRD